MKKLLATIGIFLVNLQLWSALILNGTSSLINFQDRNQYDAQSKLGVMFWVFMDSTGGNAFGVMMGDLNLVTFDMGWTIQKNNGSALHVLACNGSLAFGDTPAGSFPSNQWNHVVMNYDGAGVGNAGRLQVYINGVSQTLAFTGTIPASLGDNSAPLMAGALSTPGSYFAGRIDDLVMVAGRTFTTSEIDIHLKAKVRRMVNASSQWALDSYPDGSTVHNAAIVDTANQIYGVATNCVSAASLFMSYP